MKNCLEIDGVNLNFDLNRVLSNIYLQVNAGEVVALIGRNGSGKSCLMRVLFGSMKAENASVRVNGNFIEKPYQKNGLMQYLPQHHFIPDRLKVREVLYLFGFDKEKFFHDFPGFEAHQKVRLAELSGGMHRLLESLIVLESDADFVLLDEPFTHLSPLWVEKIKTIIRHKKSTKGILLTDHLIEPVHDISDRFYLLHDARTNPLSNSDQLLDVKKLLHAYALPGVK